MAQGNSHDQNFKNLILDYPQQALDFFAATESPDRRDKVRIIPIRQEQLKQRLGDCFRELDVPLLVEWADGRRETLLFVLEEESDARRFSVYRLAHYCLDLAELLKTQRLAPVVIFLNPAEGVPLSLSLGSERHQYLTFNYLPCKLSAITFEDWQHSDNLVARLNLPNMRWSPEKKIHVYSQAIRGLLSLEPDVNKRAKYDVQGCTSVAGGRMPGATIDFIGIYTQLTDNERQCYEQEYPEESAEMAGFAERFREEGMQKGERMLLERLLRHRFGPLNPELLQKLEQASAAELEQWAEDVLDARSLDDVFHE